MKISPSHVAILVPSARKAADFLNQFNFEIGPEEIWEGEGTKEIYVERAKRNSLLLMEPIKSGAYQRALEKRGPGLHHLAIDVLDLESFIDSLSGTGWLLHPKSLKYVKQINTAYLARPGFPGLIEVQEKKELTELPLFVEEVYLNFGPTLLYLLKSIGMERIVGRATHESIILNNQRVLLKDLF